jgi:hypothetical protein
MKKVLFYITLALLIISCEDVIDLDLPPSESLPVIEGRITDQPGLKRVWLSRSIAYDSQDSFPRISGADIKLFENGVLVESMTENDTASGEYLFYHQATVGWSYHIEITTDDGDLWVSNPEEMRRIPEIDTIYQRYETNNPFLEDGYYVYFGLTDPPGLGDSYQWKIAFNGEFLTGPFSLQLSDDRFVDGNSITEILINFEPLNPGDSARVEQYTLTPENYAYWNLVATQTQQVGSIFDPPPAPVIGNMRDANDPGKTVLGYFIVSGMRTADYVIQN